MHDFIHTAQFAFEGTGCQNKTGAPSYEYSPSPSTGVNNDCSPIKLYSKVVGNNTLLTVDLPPEKDNRNMLNPMSASTQPDPKSLANIAIKIREIERSKDELKKSKTDSNIPQENNYSNSNLAEVSRNLNKNFVPANFRESTIEDDGFQLVINRKKKGPVFGSKSNSQKSIAGSPTPRTMDIFIGGIDPTLSNDSLSHYMRDSFVCNPIEVKSSRINKYNQSFLVKIHASDKTKIFNPGSWDKNIVVKPFRHSRHRQT